MGVRGKWRISKRMLAPNCSSSGFTMVSCAVRQAVHSRSAYSTTTTGASGLLDGWGARLDSTMGPPAEAQAAKSSSAAPREHLAARVASGDDLTLPLLP